MMNKEMMVFVVSTPSEVGHEVLSTFTSLDDAVAFVDGNPALTVMLSPVQCLIKNSARKVGRRRLAFSFQVCFFEIQ